MLKFKEPRSTRLFYCLNFAVAALSSFWLWQFIRLFSDPSGANGYFYLKQTESLAAGLGFYFKDYSLAFLLPVAFMKATDNSLLSFQLAVVTTWFSLIVVTGFLIHNLLKENKSYFTLAATIAGILALACTTQVYELALTYYKNVFALVLFLAGLSVFFSRANLRTRQFFMSLLFLLALLSHKSMLLLIAAFGLCWFLQKVSWRKLLALMGALGLIVALFLWQFEKAFAYLRFLLQLFDGPRGWLTWFQRLPSYNVEMAITIYALIAVLLIYLFARRKLSPANKLYGDGAFIILLLALHPFQLPGANGPSYRIILLAPTLGIPLLMLCAQSLRHRNWLLPVLILPFVIQPFIGVRHLDDVFTPWSVMQEDVLRIREFVKPEDHLTSHHGLEFYIDDMTGIRSRSFLSTDPLKKQFRVAYVSRFWLKDNDLQSFLRAKALLEIGSEYILIREGDWKNLTGQLNIPKHWKNPDQQRPDFIYE